MTRKIVSIACLISSTLFISCNNDEAVSQSSKGLYYFTNLDQYFGFVANNPQLIIASNAHSGNCVNLVDTLNQCGYTFNRTKQEITNKKLRNVEVTCWIYSEDLSPECSIVCSADSAGVVVYYYQTVNVSKELTNPKEWTKVTAKFEFPNLIPDFASVKIYPFNNGKKFLFMDDFSIQFSEQ